MTHNERHQRRSDIAAAITAGTPAAEMAQRHGMSLSNVYLACKEFGVQSNGASTVKENRVPQSTFSIIAALLNTDRTMIDLAAQFRISKQRVSQIYRRCLDCGIAVRKREAGKRGKDK